MQKIKTELAVGMILCHDITKIVPGEYKGPAFKKGHIIKPGDIEELLKIGKEHIYVWECNEGYLHENDAAIRISHAAAGQGIEFSEPREGKVNLKASQKGLLKINSDHLAVINDIEEVVVATQHTNQLVGKGEIVAGTRVIPLVIREDKIDKVEDICRSFHPIIEIKPIQPLRTGIVTTGSEVYHGRIQDKFGPVVISKLEHMDCQILKHVFAPDDPAKICESILNLINEGAQMIVVTGGMSVDPDDATPGGVKATGATLVTYGAPLFPGAMFLLAYLKNIPILGLPGCVMYHKATVFDLVLPRILCGEKISRSELTRMGHGGLCLNCAECRFPSCSFGKGW